MEPRLTPQASVRPGEDGHLFRRLPAADAAPRPAGLIQRDVARRGLGVLLDDGLALGLAAPPGLGPASFDGPLEVEVVARVVGCSPGGTPGRAGAWRAGCRRADPPRRAPGPPGARTTRPSLPGRSRRASATVPLATSFGPISMRSGTPRISQSLNLKPGVSPSRSSTRTRKSRVQLSPRRCSTASSTSARSASFLKIGTITHLVRRQARRQDQALVVAVHHDDGADEARREAPRGRPAKLLLRSADRGSGCRRPWRSSARGCARCRPAGPCCRPSWLRCV